MKRFFSPFSSPATDPTQALWALVREAAQKRIAHSTVAAPWIRRVILRSPSMAAGLARLLASHHVRAIVPPEEMEKLFAQMFAAMPSIVAQAAQDLDAVVRRDPAAKDPLTPFLYFKGFHALQTHRVAHGLWIQGRLDDALFLQNRSAALYGVDIHPAARIGAGVMFDHATGIVIGETAVIEDHVSLLHNVTLGGTGKEQGDRHPKVRAGVMIGAGAKVLGNVEIGAGACIAAGSVVLESVAPHTTVAGIPARVVGVPQSEHPADTMDQAVIPSAERVS